MWKQKLGISVGNHYSLPTTDIVTMLKKIGFEAVSPEWEPNVDLKAISETAKGCNMTLQSLHAPFIGSANMWSTDKRVSEPALAEIMASLEDCHRYGIPILVVHAWIGFDNIPQPTEEGLENFGKLVDKACEYGIKIAFENTEGDEHLFALMEHFKDNAAVGFCWDSGHELCYNHSEDLLQKYGDRLIMTHLNDNLGISRFDGKTYWTDDLHLLPFDGIADWNYNVERLKKSTIPEYLNFELSMASKPERHENDRYATMPYEQFFTEAYIRACRIAYQLQK